MKSVLFLKSGPCIFSKLRSLLFSSRWHWSASFQVFLASGNWGMVANAPCSLGRWAFLLWPGRIRLKVPPPWGNVVGPGVPSTWNSSAALCNPTLPALQLPKVGAGWAWRGCLVRLLWLCFPPSNKETARPQLPHLCISTPHACACHFKEGCFCLPSSQGCR